MLIIIVLQYITVMVFKMRLMVYWEVLMIVVTMMMMVIIIGIITFSMLMVR